jgi:hypothetical protein
MEGQDRRDRSPVTLAAAEVAAAHQARTAQQHRGLQQSMSRQRAGAQTARRPQGAMLVQSCRSCELSRIARCIGVDPLRMQ